jgi:hypothetical protein
MKQKPSLKSMQFKASNRVPVSEEKLALWLQDIILQLEAFGDPLLPLRCWDVIRNYRQGGV